MGSREANKRPGHRKTMVAQGIEHEPLGHDETRLALDMQVIAFGPRAHAKLGKPLQDGRETVGLLHAQLPHLVKDRRAFRVGGHKSEHGNLIDERGNLAPRDLA